MGVLLSFLPVNNAVFMFLYRHLFGCDLNLNTKRRFVDTILGSIPVNVIESLVWDKKHKYEDRENDSRHHYGDSEGIGVSSILHASVCRLGWYDGDEFIGSVHDARLVLYERHLMVHEVGASQNMGNHERVITAERLIGRIQTSRISVRVAVIESNTRRGGTGSGVLHGHVLLINTMDDGPLFDEPEGTSSTSYVSKQSMIFPNGSYSITNNSNININSNTNSYINKSNNQNSNINSNKNSSLYGESNLKDSKTKKSNDRGTNSNISNNTNGNNFGNTNLGSTSFTTNTNDNRLSPRYSMAVKFYSLRDQERWLNLLRAPHEAAHWRSYLRTLTTPDPFNLLLTRLLVQSMRTTALGNFIHAKIQKKLDSLSIKKFPREIEGGIILDDFLLSDEVPMVSNVSSPSTSANGEVTFDFDLLYRGGATLCLRLNLTYRGLRIPHVVCAVTIERAAGRLRLSVGPPPSKKFWLGLLSPPTVRLTVAPGLSPPAAHGPLHRLIAALPDLSHVASQLLHLYLLDEMGLPVMDDYPLPSVQKTPPASPHNRKSWNTKFDRKNAAAHSRSHHATTSTPASSAVAAAETAATATATAVAAGMGSFMNAIKSYRSRFSHYGDGSTEESPLGKELSFRPLRDPLQEDEEEVDNEKNEVVINTPSEMRSTSETTVSTLSGLPPNSEDARRHRIKKKAEEIMRPAVKAALQLPTPSEQKNYSS
ncbi:uncharacterized protein TM35_000321930 [Trypanosoma theileri]|uniref:SMP-LTD domain-containing protein n=1 Tax=Trypanosoma theileri TaxID=67003 RepID=A0A1X0NN11_9TRYP|nr:uncharacterized protein TM35_000321930 [Trypanosoma theileri]ORC85878.1 hypothetical protein TM35_000321930 [Trypanosoma theileri]